VVKSIKSSFLPQNMSDILSYIQNPKKTQRLIGVKYKQLKQLMKQAITLHTEKQQEREAKKIKL